MIKVFVQKTMAQAVVDTPLTSGSKGLTVEFVFSEDWNGLEKTAVFETSSFYKETEQLTGETIEVPEDVMAWANETLYVGVYGTAQNGATVIPTVYADCGRIQKGANDTPGGRPLTPAQSDILQNQINNLGSRVEWLESSGGSGGESSLLLDTTLTQSGKAADAKAVGDALENVGGKAYVQDTEPAQMEVGEFWYNPDEETEGIPTTLPNPHKLTFSGAVNAEYDGSEAVEVVIPQGGGGGGATNPEFIKEFSITEDGVKSIEIINGDVEYRGVYIFFNIDSNCNHPQTTEDTVLYGKVNDSWEVGLGGCTAANRGKYIYIDNMGMSENTDGGTISSLAGHSSYNFKKGFSALWEKKSLPYKHIKKVELLLKSETASFANSLHVSVYGVRA